MVGTYIFSDNFFAPILYMKYTLNNFHFFFSLLTVQCIKPSTEKHHIPPQVSDSSDVELDYTGVITVIFVTKYGIPLQNTPFCNRMWHVTTYWRSNSSEWCDR